MQTILITGSSSDIRYEKALEIIEKSLSSEFETFKKSTDFRVIDLKTEKTRIPIEEVREIINYIHTKPGRWNLKAVIIIDANNISLEGQNAFLKTLEEPPEYCQLILTANHNTSLLPTVVSRCKHISLSGSGVISVDSGYESEFLMLLNSNPGKAIDWINENKDLLKDRETVVEIINSWEKVLRELLLGVSDAGNNNEYKEVFGKYKRKQLLLSIKYLYRIKTDILRYNANVPLSLETFLMSLILCDTLN